MRIRVLLLLWLVLPACGDPAPLPPPAAPPQPAPAVETAARRGCLRLGATLDLTGADARCGRSYVEGLRAAFAAVNEAGGVNGQDLELEVLDDHGRPAMAARNARALLERTDDPVLALTGLGPLCGTVVLTIAQQHGVLLYAPVGAGIDPIVQSRVGAAVLEACVQDEICCAVRMLVDEAGVDPARIAFVTQRDSVGEEAFAAGVAALGARGVRPQDVRHQRAEPLSTGIERHVDALASEPLPPQACVLAADADVVTAFLLAARASDLQAIFVCTSRADPEAIDGPACAGAHVVMLQALDPEPGAGAPPGSSDARKREGWLAGRILAAALRRCGRDPGRARASETVRALLAEGPEHTRELSAFPAAGGRPSLWPLLLEASGPRPLRTGEMGGFEVRR